MKTSTAARAVSRASGAAAMLRTLVVVASLLRTSSAACPSVVAHDCVCLESARAVHCIGKNLTTVPDDLPSLLHLTVVDNSIEMIVTPIRYGSLTSLVLDRNRISYIADRMFAELANVTKLSLMGNQLSRIGANTFYGLESLVFLILDHNPLFRLDRGPFSSGHLRSLRILKVSRCSIYTLNRGALAELPRLGFLDLSHNMLNELPDFTEVGSSGLTQLECMDLSSNRIVSIGEDRCRSLSSLARLVLANNSIGELRPRSLGGLSTSLTLLDVSHNRLADLSSALANAITLTDLLLPYNNLSALDDGSIPWASLQRITLHDNPWNCSCAAAWLVRQPLVSQWNVNATIRWVVGSPRQSSAVVRCRRKSSEIALNNRQSSAIVGNCRQSSTIRIRRHSQIIYEST